MDEAKFLEIMSDDELGGEKMFAMSGCNALAGLLIIQQYLPTRGIEGAGHDVIYSVSVDSLIRAGITEEDVTELRALNWMVEDGSYMACFV